MSDPGQTTAPGTMPVAARVHLAHAIVQRLAADSGADVLHLKGPALLPGLRPHPHRSSDVDVLVRPTHLRRLVVALEGVGFEQRTGFSTGSVFAHAANWWHDDWGWVDLHVSWPGITRPAEEAFDVLLRDAVDLPVAHQACPAPGRTAQQLVLVLHAARSGSAEAANVWRSATDDERADVRALAAELGAEVALAAGIGELDLWRDHPDHDLWRHFVEGGNRLDLWRARLAAAPGPRAKVRLVASAFRVNRDHLRMELGRVPTPDDVRARQRERVRRAWRDLRSRGDRP